MRIPGCRWLVVIVGFCVAAALPSSAHAVDDGTMYCISGAISRTIDWVPDPGYQGLPWGPTPIDSPTYRVEVSTETPSLRSWTMHTSYTWETDDPFPVPALSARYAPYLAPEPGVIQSDDAAIRALAASLVQGCVWQSDAVERIQTWIARNIAYDSTFASDQDASAALRRRSGTCSGYSSLAVALCRAAGIPAAWVDGTLAEGSLTVSSPTGSASQSYPTGDHAWFTVFYPRTGWVLIEPQDGVNVLSTQHYHDFAPVDISAPAGSTYLPGVSVGPPVSTLGITSIVTFTPENDKWRMLFKPTTLHEAAPRPLPSAVRIDIDRSGRGWRSPGSDVVRPWVVGSPALAWCALRFDGKVLSQGPPAHVLKRHDVSKEQMANGPHTLALTVEDVAGRTFTATVDVSSATVCDRCVPVEGANRIGTAIAASRAAFTKADTVVLATAWNFPDALGGASLAGALDAPLLLTDKDSLPSAVVDEIERLGATEAVILGGTPAVGANVATQLATLLGGSGHVTRIGGADRYETAALVGAEAIKVLAAKGQAFDGTVMVAVGDNFPDALAASPLAAAKGWPILLTPTGSLPPASASALTALGAKKAIVLGSESAVSANVAGDLAATVGGPANVIRLAGANRYLTAVAIAKYGKAAGLGFSRLAVATGENYPDALSGGVMAGRFGSMMLLTPRTSLHPDVAKLVTAEKAGITKVYYLGSTAAVSQPVRDAMAVLLK